MTDAAMETVLRRDRLIVAAALALMTGLAWAYVWWLAPDLDMGGVDLSGFRMIPAGRGWVKPTTAAWTGMRLGRRFAIGARGMNGMIAPRAHPHLRLSARL